MYTPAIKNESWLFYLFFPLPGIRISTSTAVHKYLRKIIIPIQNLIQYQYFGKLTLLRSRRKAWRLEDFETGSEVFCRVHMDVFFRRESGLQFLRKGNSTEQWIPTPMSALDAVRNTTKQRIFDRILYSSDCYQSGSIIRLRPHHIGQKNQMKRSDDRLWQRVVSVPILIDSF